MAEYIAREELLAQLRAMESYNVSPMYRRGYDDCVATVLNAPTADVVPVVRCKDCENAQNECGGMIICRVYKHIMWLQDFCSYGKRKGGGADNG